MNLDYLLPDASEVQLIYSSVIRLYGESKAPQMDYADLNAACSHISDAWGNDRLVVVGDFALLYDVGKMWYSSSPMIFEKLVIRFRKEVGNQVDDVVPVLESLRLKHKCVAIVTGDAQRGLMRPVYTRAGYVPVGEQFFKG